MRKIQKIISLEPMTSRLPSILPAYKDNKLYFFDDASLKARDYLYPSNYGMIPVNIGVNNTPFSCTTKDYSLISCPKPKTTNIVSLEVEDGDSFNGFTLSFERLSQWYYKFKEYYHLLNDYGHCGVVYTSAQEYYKNESKKYPQDMVYGTDEDTYIALDEEMAKMGACVSSVTYSCGSSSYTHSVDSGFYKWICDNVIPTFTIPKPYQDYWKRTTLYYPDVINWIGWFEARNGIYSGYTEEENCAALAVPTPIDDCHYKEGDCCECKEYVNRGGSRMSVSLTSWYEGVQRTISSITNTVSANTSCFIPYVINPITLQGSLHTNGEMSVICEEYELGVDYRTSKYDPISGFGITENVSNGAVISKDGKLMKLISGGGYTYDEKYMETVFDENAWEYLPYDETYDAVIPQSGTSTPIIFNLTKAYSSYDIITNAEWIEVGGVAEQRNLIVTAKENYETTRFATISAICEDCESKIFRIKQVGSLSGTTTSKLRSIHSSNYLVDDIGNTIYGIYNLNSSATTFQPPIYTELEPIYQIGKIVNVSRIGDSGDTFIGDEIDSMLFYYKTTDGEMISGTSAYSNSSGSLSAISAATSALTLSGNSALTYYDDIFCDITYHVGNIYTLNSSKTAVDSGKTQYGIEYTETVNFVKERVEYYLKKKDNVILPYQKKNPNSHSISYPIYVYTLKQEVERIEDNTYNTPYDDSLATFNANIDRPSINGDSGDTYFPLFMEEYKLGTAAPQSVKGDIYIDRGINAAFEKHLKLGEVTTLEALIQYGNSYFKIMDK